MQHIRKNNIVAPVEVYFNKASSEIAAYNVNWVDGIDYCVQEVPINEE